MPDWSDRKEALRVITNQDVLPRQVPDVLRNDRSFIMEAIMVNAFSIAYASDELRNDIDMLQQSAPFPRDSWIIGN